MPDDASGVLADGSAPARADDLFNRFRALGIAFTTVEHPPVNTVEEAKARRGAIPGGHSKNLFLRNKKGEMWLVVCPEDRAVNLKTLGSQLGAGHLSFASGARLMRHLGLLPGAVTPFGVLNDHARAVRVAVDRAVLEHEPLNFHPLVNHMTTSVSAADFLRFLEAEGHPAEMVRLE